MRRRAGRGRGNETTCDGNLIPAGLGEGERGRGAGRDFLKLFKLNRLLERWREDAGGGEKAEGKRGIRERGNVEGEIRVDCEEGEG